MDYIKQCMRTLSETYTGNSIMHHNLQHATLGVAGEYFEMVRSISTANYLEELADMIWYACLFAKAGGISEEVAARFNFALHKPLEELPEENLADVIGFLVDTQKRQVHYGKTIEVDWIAQAFSILNGVATHLQETYPKTSQRLTLGMLTQAVVNKLMKRWPDKFDAQDGGSEKNYEIEIKDFEILANIIDEEPVDGEEG